MAEENSMDFNAVARDIVAELKTYARRTDGEIAKRLGISRQAYIRRRGTNTLTTENITVLSAWLVTEFGGGFYINNLLPAQPKEQQPETCTGAHCKCMDKGCLNFHHGDHICPFEQQGEGGSDAEGD